MLRSLAFASSIRRAPAALPLRLSGPTAVAQPPLLARGFSSRPTPTLLAAKGKKRGGSPKGPTATDADAAEQDEFELAFDEARAKKKSSGAGGRPERRAKGEDALGGEEVGALFDELSYSPRGGGGGGGGSKPPRHQQQRRQERDADEEGEDEEGAGNGGQPGQWNSGGGRRNSGGGGQGRQPSFGARGFSQQGQGYLGQQQRYGGGNNNNRNFTNQRNQGFRNAQYQSRPQQDQQQDHQQQQQQQQQGGNPRVDPEVRRQQQQEQIEKRQRQVREREERELQAIATLQALAEDMSVLRQVAEAIARSGKYGKFEEIVTLRREAERAAPPTTAAASAAASAAAEEAKPKDEEPVAKKAEESEKQHQQQQQHPKSQQKEE